MVLRARRGVRGDVPGPWQGRLPARIAQRLHVGELEPEPCFLGVGGQFHDLVRTTRKINYVDAENATEGRLVTPNTSATLGMHVVASPASHGALEGGGLSVRSLVVVNY